jgi:hypothetical protein
MPSCGTITVVSPFDPGSVTASCNVNGQQATAGETISISATVTNGNNTRAAYTLTFQVGSSISEQVTGTVPANASSSESITVELGMPGDYPVDVSVDASRA